MVLEGDRLILGTPRGGHFEWQRVPLNDDATSCTTSDSELRQTLLGSWRLISNRFDVDSTVFKPLGDDPQGYLVYTPDGHVIVQMATRAERDWRGPEVLELPGTQLMAALGFFAYCGTVEVRDGQAVHRVEFGILPSWSGRVEPRSVTLDGERLILFAPSGSRNEWQRVHSAEPV